MGGGIRILFVSLSDDVGSDRIVSALGQQGAACAVLGLSGSFPSLSRFVEERFGLPRVLGAWGATFGLRRRLSTAVRRWQPTHVVPLDEFAALALRTLALDLATPLHLRVLLTRSFGAPEGYRAACHRWPLMQVATEAGVPIPRSAAAGQHSELQYPLVVKRDHSSGSGGVMVARNAAEAEAAIRQAGRKHRLKTFMARAAGFDHGTEPILVQEFVDGTLAMHTVVTDAGRVVDGFSCVAVKSHPEKRSSTILQWIENAAMDESVRKLVAALGCSGFVSFDFIVDDQARPWLLEMNPRPIGSTHLGQVFGHDLAHAFLTGEPQHAAVPSQGPVALFPKELERDPSGTLADSVSIHHDVPWDEPAVIAAYVGHLTRMHPGRAADLHQRFGSVGSAPARRTGFGTFLPQMSR